MSKQKILCYYRSLYEQQKIKQNKYSFCHSRSRLLTFYNNEIMNFSQKHAITVSFATKNKHSSHPSISQPIKTQNNDHVPDYHVLIQTGIQC